MKTNFKKLQSFKGLLIPSLSLFIIAEQANAQVNLTFPSSYVNQSGTNYSPSSTDNNKVYDARIEAAFPTTNFGTSCELAIAASYNGGNITRSLINFPELQTWMNTYCLTTSPFTSATLKLFNTQYGGNYSCLSQSNSGVGSTNDYNVYRVTSSWNESVTWNTQPTWTTANGVSAYAAFLDPSVNVLGMVNQMIANNQYYGFLIKLQVENAPVGTSKYWKLASSEWCSAATCTSPTSLTRRPRLELELTSMPSTCRIMYSGVQPIATEKHTDATINEVSIFPNPFTANTTVSYTLLKDSQVSFSICDLTGKELKNYPAKTMLQAGHYETKFDDFEASPGIYLLRIVSNGQTQTHKLVKSL